MLISFMLPNTQTKSGQAIFRSTNGTGQICLQSMGLFCSRGELLFPKYSAKKHYMHSMQLIKASQA